MSDLVPGVFLRLPQVLEVIPVSKATWYNGVKAGTYPAPVNIGPHTVAWRSDDIIALRDRLAGGVWKPFLAGPEAALEAKRAKARRDLVGG